MESKHIHSENHDGPTSEGPIFSLAQHCDDILQECLNEGSEDHSSTKRLLEDYGRRFRAWWEYVGVFAEKKVNLDRRLHRQPEIRDIVVRLLIILERNLAQLKDCQATLLGTSSVRVPSQPTQAATTVDDGVGIDDMSSLVTISLEAIDESLTELSQVGIAIRQSSKTSETVRARRFVAGHANLRSYEALTFITLETLYPNAPESLLAQLSRSMVDRYARLLFRAPRNEVLKGDIRKSKSEVAPVGLANELGIHIAEPELNVAIKATGRTGPGGTHHCSFNCRLESVSRKATSASDPQVSIWYYGSTCKNA
ncbi:hypothetical protein DRE_02242 [Drechslerella stenobrocha 248]|uniref:Uncharacterized protein n=1 Tax=Drechslerella stenobrocha 248 TaxID=1043628 RepID=W7I870_9PEZI|nr:hypothetical protein DRE_02242 [Drechslerella stenobrocha 248]